MPIYNHITPTYNHIATNLKAKEYEINVGDTNLQPFYNYIAIRNTRRSQVSLILVLAALTTIEVVCIIDFI